MRVRILRQFQDGIKREGTIYNHVPNRPCPWHVLPDNWPEGLSGIAFTEEELEPIETQEE
jgi:hypothetical protein